MSNSRSRIKRAIVNKGLSFTKRDLPKVRIGLQRQIKYLTQFPQLGASRLLEIQKGIAQLDSEDLLARAQLESSHTTGKGVDLNKSEKAQWERAQRLLKLQDEHSKLENDELLNRTKLKRAKELLSKMG